MCGIAGWVSFDSAFDDRSADAIESMTATMSRRGPDATGTFVRENVALGHRRLAVIDPAGGRQPMVATESGHEVALVYSGEMYNYTELRAELKARGRRFETRSDTEVLLLGYLEWGESIVERLNGMFAFAIWDQRQERLFLARDRFGIKPLYVYRIPSGIVFGSEPKAILAHPLADRTVTVDGLRELFAMTGQPGWSLWRDMDQVRPGTTLTVERTGIAPYTYWSLQTRQHTDDIPTTVQRVRGLLDDIVERQLVSDVPLCVLLSGGLDSSTLTGLAAATDAAKRQALRTFSVDFEDQEKTFVPDEIRDTPDAPFVREVIELVKTNHHRVALDQSALSRPSVRRAVVGARDIPAGLGDMDNSLYLLFRAIREQSTVALSGESADEIFGGYIWFHHPGSVNADNFPWLAFRSAFTADRFALLNHDLRAKLELDDFIADQYAVSRKAVEHLPGDDDREKRMRLISHQHLTRFLPMLLDRKDRASMAVGLEVRVPYCDHRLVDYVYNTPWSFKTFDGREKSLLREACGALVPQAVRDRVKSPYPTSQDPRYAASLAGQLSEILAHPDHPVFAIVDRQWAQAATEIPPDKMPGDVRAGLDRILDVYHWLDMYSPDLLV
ncbi:asparagine synthase (glutamine-hydrolyzing) [Streptomyces spectabilis]|uniref:asparagine synthase (glutamine-hydrolyzing) n=1 Tax=Streptomyces spectabilis TaxID=68270 RepID=A0A5P2X281_STRST|nr:asparagine synthase (glutamine-hydrolyzing) [Streptomyces spectabilis]MBB5101006.1 asparagine synthase (glutamine-hydrolyzing) [Streptomyces spectabilis]MCI3900218.1 asparagine synthase (glutamine-hydrolyzing) [Streptomyces spectabilis]QEV57824.1 asparagine synthase (glutamine-hydrolyzing) [Streptomyces spectabilis]GGV08937.1 asparagine synthetase B [Streptomyces spectabilis]